MILPPLHLHWERICTHEPRAGHLVQVVPVADLYPHVLGDVETDNSQSCWCSPLVDEEGIVVHNAYDQRELIEQGNRLVQ